MRLLIWLPLKLLMRLLMMLLGLIMTLLLTLLELLMRLLGLLMRLLRLIMRRLSLLTAQGFRVACRIQTGFLAEGSSHWLSLFLG